MNTTSPEVLSSESSTTSRFPTGLYGITPDWRDFDRLYTALEQVCAAGIPILQWRRKHTPFALACEQASKVATLCKNHGTIFVINDDWRLALEVGADAVHLGKEDGNVKEIKALLKQHRSPIKIGVSCYNQLALAQQAIADGVDYFAFGAVFSSSVKPNAVHAPLALFAQAKQLLPINNPPRIVGIGGITLANAQQVIAAGADSIAVISGLFEQDDIYQTCCQFMRLFK